jgi:hypothetical protein
MLGDGDAGVGAVLADLVADGQRPGHGRRVSAWATPMPAPAATTAAAATTAITLIRLWLPGRLGCDVIGDSLNIGGNSSPLTR